MLPKKNNIRLRLVEKVNGSGERGREKTWNETGHSQWGVCIFTCLAVKESMACLENGQSFCALDNSALHIQVLPAPPDNKFLKGVSFCSSWYPSQHLQESHAQRKFSINICYGSGGLLVSVVSPLIQNHSLEANAL